MNKPTPIIVQFYVEIDGSILAYFPLTPYNKGKMRSCYSHVGQHSGCHPDYISDCRTATPDEYAQLKKELESIGYKVIVNTTKQ